MSARLGHPSVGLVLAAVCAHVLAQPRQELAGNVLAAARKLHDRADVVLLVARIEPAGVGENAVHAAAVVMIERRKRTQSIAELELAAMTGRGVAQDSEDRRNEDAPADHHPDRASVGGGGRLD